MSFLSKNANNLNFKLLYGEFFINLYMIQNIHRNLVKPKTGIRSHELAVLLSRGKSLDEISDAISSRVSYVKLKFKPVG